MSAVRPLPPRVLACLLTVYVDSDPQIGHARADHREQDDCRLVARRGLDTVQYREGGLAPRVQALLDRIRRHRFRRLQAVSRM